MASYSGYTPVVSGTTGGTRTVNFTTLTPAYTLTKYDWLIVTVFANFTSANTATFTPPSGQGWSLLTSSSDQSPDTTHHFAVYKKQWGVTGNTDSLTAQFSVTTGTTWGAVGEVWSSPSGQWDPTAPIRDSAFTVVGSSPTTTMTAPTCTTNASAGDTVMRRYATCDNNTPTTKQYAGDTYAINGTTVNVNTTANGYSLGVVYRDNASAGAVGTATLLQTAQGPDNWVAWTVILVPGPPPPEVWSTYLNNYCHQNIENDDPAGSGITTGVTSTNWWMMPDPGVAPWSRARGDQVGIYLTNASYNQFQCNPTIRFDQIDGSSVTVTIGLDLYGSENLMAQYDLVSFSTDYTTAKGWIGVGTQVVIGATSATVNMWYQLGPTGSVMGPYSTTIAYTVAGFADLTFDHVGGFNINSDDYPATDPANFYNITFVAGASVPANSVIAAMLKADATAYPGAWAHYRFRWVAGIVLTDDTGHGRNMIASGGLTPAVGPLAPTFPSSALAGGFFLLMVNSQ